VAGPSIPVLHLLSGLEIGGKEKVALLLARRGRAEGHDHRLLLFDAPFRSADIDFDPGDVPWTFIPRGGGLDLGLPTRIRAEARRHGIRVLHAHNDSAIVYGALTALLSRGAMRTIGTFHTWPSHDTTGARVLNRLVAAAAFRVTSVSAELRERLLMRGWLGACDVVPNGIDTADFYAGPADRAWRARLNLASHALLVAQIGRLDPIKRAEDLIMAAQLLATRHPDIAFRLVGRGAHRPVLDRLIGDAANIRILDHIDDMPGFLRAVDIAALCSDHEASPLVLLEAMASGRAIVATAVGGIPDMLSGPDGQLCGELVAPRRPELLAAAIAALATDPARREDLGARARRRAQDFSFEKSWDAYRRLYCAALSEGGAAL
jgi:glycosyltransferase involved in cell wall biosynthesis